MKTRRVILSFLSLVSIVVVAPGAQAVTLTVNADHGTVTRIPDKTAYGEGEVVTLVPRPEGGYYFTGWAGDAQGRSLSLELVMTGDKTVTASFSPWQPPIGIPAPAFGIHETHYMYEGKTYDFGAGPEPYRDAGHGPYTHYVDNTHPSATDTANPYGTAAKPRLTIPRSVPAGSVVEIHGGPYASDPKWNGAGTSENPIFYRGADVRNRPRITVSSTIGFYGYLDAEYIIFENLHFYRVPIQAYRETHHIAVRNSEVEGDLTQTRTGGISIATPTAALPEAIVHDIVIYNNEVHNVGDWQASGDPDGHGMAITADVSNVWILDNLFYHNSGNGVQVNAGGLAVLETTHHIYMGRNQGYQNKQDMLWTKSATDVVFSQNAAWDHRASDSSLGGAMGLQYGPMRVWFLFNEIRDCTYGIRMSTDDGGGGRGPGTDTYVIGNLIRGIHRQSGTGGLNVWKGGAGVLIASEESERYILLNTIYDTDAGVLNARRAKLKINNNIFSNVTEEHVFFEFPDSLPFSDIADNLFDNPARLIWGRSGDQHVYDLPSFSAAYPGKADGSIQADAVFVDAGRSDFRLQPSSPAIDAQSSSTTVQQACDKFELLYALDIRKDLDGSARPQGHGWDFGAYEYPAGPTADPLAPETSDAGAGNRYPVIEPVGDRSVVENETLTFVVSATDPDGDALTYYPASLPAGADFDSSTRTFTWTPAGGQAGAYSVTFRVSDGQVTASLIVRITVTEPAPPENQAPKLASIEDRSVDENASLSFPLSASDPDGDSLTFAATGLPSGANFENGTFSWAPTAGQAGSYPIGFSVSDGELTDSQQVMITVVRVGDRTPPVVRDLYPPEDEVQVPLNPLITFAIADAGSGVDANSVNIQVDGQTVYAGDRAIHETAYGTCRRTGTQASYSYNFHPAHVFNFDQQVSVRISASDRARNAMSPVTCQFTTEMQSFGRNEPVSADRGDTGHPAVATDSLGNIWVAWHAGQTHARDIYVARRSSQSQQWDAPVQLTDLSSDQCNPAIALGTDDTLYVSWQDNRRGNWDIYVSAGPNGGAWQESVRITDSNDNQVHPAIAVDQASPNHVYIAWEDDSAGNRDIYLASSTPSFAARTVMPVTSDGADQTGPALTVGGDNIVYLVWTDQRNGSSDVYGSSSVASSWANVPIATGPGNQNDPAIAVEPGTSLLHMLWVDDTAGDLDILYGTSDGLPAGPLSGRNIVDDSTGADQFAPAIVIAKDYQNVNHVYACWRDNRSVADSADSDLYFAEIRSGVARTNILVGDDGANSNQGEPALGFDEYGQPIVLWVDNRSNTTGVYAACSTYPKPDVLASALIPAAEGGDVGTNPVSSADNVTVSVRIPSNASRFDTVFSIMQMRNPPSFRSGSITGYEIGPSGMQFSIPITVTIPRTGSVSGRGVPYWYNPQTGTLSQQGVTDVTNSVLPNGTPVVSFRTTHLTTFYIMEHPAGGAVSDSNGGGGCALSRSHEGGLLEYLLPFGVLGFFMAILKWKDRRLAE